MEQWAVADLDLGEEREVDLGLFDCVPAVEFEVVVALHDDRGVPLAQVKGTLAEVIEGNLIL